jgi:hypothetical protein
MPISITCPVSDVPDGTVVRRVTGRKPCTVRRKIRVYGDPAEFDNPPPRKLMKPMEAEAGTAFLMYPSGHISAVPAAVKVCIEFETTKEKQAFLTAIGQLAPQIALPEGDDDYILEPDDSEHD